MKIYILTCVNEDGDVVSVEPFKTRESANATMCAQYSADRREFEEHETLDPDHDFIEENIASTGNDTYYYVWQIFEREL